MEYTVAICHESIKKDTLLYACHINISALGKMIFTLRNKTSKTQIFIHRSEVYLLMNELIVCALLHHGYALTSESKNQVNLEILIGSKNGCMTGIFWSLYQSKSSSFASDS